MTSIFPSDPTFRSNLQACNAFDLGKFSMILSHMCSKIHATQEAFFSERESQQLCNLFQISSSHLLQILSVLSFMFEQLTYHGSTPEQALEESLAAGLSQDHAEAFAKTWHQNKNDIIGRAREQSVGGQVLAGTAWRLHLEMAQATLGRVSEPRAVFEFDKKDSKVTVEFSHESLADFYNKLELIQMQLDQVLG